MSEPSTEVEHDLPSLEEFLIECQKSLARVASSSAEASKADSEFVRGERPSYAVDGVTFKISAGIQMGESKVWAGSPRIKLDFNAAAAERCELEFRVESRPMEIVSGAKLEIANLDPLGNDLPLLKLRVWLVNDRGQPVADYKIKLHFLVAGAKREVVFDTFKTDAAGRCDFFLEPYKAEKQLKVVGVRKAETVHLRHSARGRGPDEFYVWATCDRALDWLSVVEPATTESTVLPEERELPSEISSERLRIRIPAESINR
jgi:hypothetical protein